MSFQAVRRVCVCSATISSFDCVPLRDGGSGRGASGGLLASLAASNVKKLGLLVMHASMSRNSRHSEYGFEINS